jgi:iron complex outermembrane receptor protein
LLIQKNQSAVASLVWELQDEDNPVAAPLTVGVRGMNTNEQGDVFAYAGGINSPQAALPGALNEIRDRRARNLEIFGRGEVPIAPNLIASASLAAVWTDRRVSDVPGPGNAMGIVSQYDQSYHDLLPGAGLVWKPQRDMMVFANWSQSFEAPSFFDLGGNAPLQADRIPRLSAQRADTFELGTRGQSGPVRWDITLFHSRIAGEVLTIDAAGALNPPITNADRTTRTGLEAAIVLDLAGLLGGEPGTNTLSAKWDWLRARFDNDPVYGNNIVAGIPEHNALIELQLQPVDGLAIRPNLTIRSRTETDLLNTPGQAADGFVLAGLSMRYEIGKVAIWVDARNIGNRRYVSAVNVVNRSTATSGLFFPGDGRSVFGGITFRL